MSGYDIKKLVDAGLSHFWNENYGQIYPTLDLLVSDGLATREEDAAGGQRKRFVYTITDLGREAFRAWLAEPTLAPIVRNELQLKFFLSCNLPNKETIRLVKEYQSQQQALLDDHRRSEELLRRALRDGTFPKELNELLENSYKRRTHQSRMKQCQIFLLTLRHGVRAIEARLAWCGEALKILEQ